MEYDNFNNTNRKRREKKKKKKNHPSLSDIILSYRNSPYVEQSTD